MTLKRQYYILFLLKSVSLDATKFYTLCGKLCFNSFSKRTVVHLCCNCLIH